MRQVYTGVERYREIYTGIERNHIIRSERNHIIRREKTQWFSE